MDKIPYTYTVLRYVHDTTTTEYVNIGVVLLSPSHFFIKAKIQQHYGSRVSKTFRGIHGNHYRRITRNLQSYFDNLHERLQEPLSTSMDVPENVHQAVYSVIPEDDSSFQWSPMGSGLSSDLNSALDTIYERMVTRYEEKNYSSTRSDDEVWMEFRSVFQEKKILESMEPKVISTNDDSIEFKHAYKNGVWHCLESVSFDLIQPQSIIEKARSRLGGITSIRDSSDPFKVYYLVGEPREKDVGDAFHNALSILGKTPVDHQIVREYEANGFANQLHEMFER